MIYAHSRKGLPEEEWQPLDVHHKNVAELAAGFAASWAPKTAALLGGSHDTGKNSDSFQACIRGKGGKVDHTSAAWLYLTQQWGPDPAGLLLARLLAWPLLGHHGGMMDSGSQAESGTLAWRLSGDRINAVPDWKPERSAPLPPAVGYFQELRRLMSTDGKSQDPFATAFTLRMLYSCLVDADYLDTEHVCSPERHDLRPAWPALTPLGEKFFQHLKTRGFLPHDPVSDDTLKALAKTACAPDTRPRAIRAARAWMLDSCIEAAGHAPGFFSLTMPTGGGKTLSSLAFALRHAREHGLARVVLVVPYTSIIEQNADVLRKALGEDAVLEHHSNYIHPAEENDDLDESASIAYRLTKENWDASVTTSVRFFESLFAKRSSRSCISPCSGRSASRIRPISTLPPFTGTRWNREPARGSMTAAADTRVPGSGPAANGLRPRRHMAGPRLLRPLQGCDQAPTLKPEPIPDHARLGSCWRRTGGRRPA